MTTMFKEFDKICRKHNLKYWCISGTLLGVIRHKGWIPYDGDIDVGMLTDDYKKLRKIIQKELPKGMWFQDKITDKYYKSDIGKIRDLNSNYKDYKDQSWHNGLQLDIFIVKDTDGILSWDGCNINKKDIFPLIERKFEELMVFIPHNYDLVLKNVYDENYMKMMPIKQRIPHEGRMDILNAPKWMRDKYPQLYK